MPQLLSWCEQLNQLTTRLNLTSVRAEDSAFGYLSIRQKKAQSQAGATCHTCRITSELFVSEGSEAVEEGPDQRQG